jgi:hypothetical protein
MESLDDLSAAFLEHAPCPVLPAKYWVMSSTGFSCAYRLTSGVEHAVASTVAAATFSA